MIVNSIISLETTVFDDINKFGSNHLKSIMIEEMLKANNVKKALSKDNNNDHKIREFAKHKISQMLHRHD